MPFTEVGGNFEESEWRSTQGDDHNSKYIRTSFYHAGRDGYTSPPTQDPDKFEELENVLPPVTGTLRKRYGIASFCVLNGGSLTTVYTINLYENPQTGKRRLIVPMFDGVTKKMRTFDETGTLKNTGVFTYSGNPDLSRLITSRTYTYHLNQTAADQLKYDGNDTSGSGTTTWGIAAPTTSVTVGSTGSGNITINFYRDYTYAYYNTTTGQISDIAPFSTGSRLQGPLTGVNVALSTITADSNSANTGTTRRVILCTSDGGPQTRLYLLHTIADNSTTTYTDSLDEATLITQNIMADLDGNGNRLGVLGNQPPPNGKYVCKHRGRVYIVTLDNRLAYSKSITEVSTASGLEIGGRYEECYPPENIIDLAPQPEVVQGILSDGTNLHIGTRRNIYRLSGSGPADFQPPYVEINAVGLANDLTWQMIYIQGEPVGAMWMTPDYRVVFSNFNTYQDLSLPIRDRLNTQSSYGYAASCATYASSRDFNLYALGFNVGGEILAYDINNSRWHRWIMPTSLNPTAQFFWQNPSTGQPQWLVAGTSQTNIGTFSPSAVSDVDVSTDWSTPVAIAATVKTTWLSLDSPNLRKALNKLEVISDITGVDVSVTVEGAETAAQFTSPATVVSGVYWTASPSGDFWVKLAGKPSKYKWYRFTFSFPNSSAAVTTNLLAALTVDFCPLGQT